MTSYDTFLRCAFCLSVLSRCVLSRSLLSRFLLSRCLLSRTICLHYVLYMLVPTSAILHRLRASPVRCCVSAFLVCAACFGMCSFARQVLRFLFWSILRSIVLRGPYICSVFLYLISIRRNLCSVTEPLLYVRSLSLA